MGTNKIYVANIPYHVDEAGLRVALSRYGHVIAVELLRERTTGRSKGTAFVTFATVAAAEHAVFESGFKLAGRPLVMRFERPYRSPQLNRLRR